MTPLFVDPDITSAKTLDKAFYLDRGLFERVSEQIFRRSWHFAGDAEQVQHNNDCLPFTLLPGYLDEPLVLVRDHSGKLRCFSNACTHRGNLVVNAFCNQPQLRCRYHGRIFGQDGKFRAMPEFKEVKDFPSDCDHLSQRELATWGKLLFVSPSDAVPAGAFLDDMKQRMHWLPMDAFHYAPGLSQVFTVKAHWALYCENYLEGFHIPFVHAGLNAVIDFGAYTTELFRYSNLQLGIAKDGKDCFDLPPSSADHGKHVAAYYFFVFPNLMFNFYPWGLSLNIVEPVDLSTTRVRFLYFVWKKELMHKGAGAALGKVEHEDEEVVEAVQQGIRSSFYSHGRYSPSREQGTHHFHRLVAEFMNTSTQFHQRQDATEFEPGPGK